MILDEKLNQIELAHRQQENRKKLKESREKKKKKNQDLRREIIIGKLFIKNFPIVQKFIPGRSKEEDIDNFEALDKFMKVLSECFQSYQEIEDFLNEH